MADHYIGTFGMDAILEGACAVTDWPKNRSWPKVVRHLRKVGIDDAYIEERKDFIEKTLRRHAFHFGGDVTDAEPDPSSLHNPPQRSQQWPPTPPDSERDPRNRAIDHGWSGSSSPHRNGQRPSQLKPSAEIRTLPYGKTSHRSFTLSSVGEDSYKTRPAKIWSFKRSDWHPATTAEGLSTSKNFVRREIVTLANLEIEELDGLNEALSGKDEFFPSEGIVVIALRPEGCIQTLFEKFLVTSDEDAPDLTIGHDLSAKIARSRDAIRSYAAMKNHYRYEARLYSGLGDSESQEFPHACCRTLEPALADGRVQRGYLQPGANIRSPHIDQQGSEAQERVSRFDEKSPLISSQPPVRSVTRKSSNTDRHSVSSTASRAMTVDVSSQLNQTNGALPVSTASFARNQDHQDCPIRKLNRLTILLCVTGMIGLIILSSLLSSYLVQRWGVSP